jgi:hypothetical protein
MNALGLLSGRGEARDDHCAQSEKICHLSGARPSDAVHNLLVGPATADHGVDQTRNRT